MHTRTSRTLRLLAAATALTFALLPHTVHAQSSSETKDDLFAGTERFAKNASDVTEVTMDPDTLGLVGGRNKTAAKRTKLSIVRTYTYDKPGMYNMADVEEYRRKLETAPWHCSIHVRELKRGESTDVCKKERTDGLVETAIITVEPKELTFIHTIREAGSGGGVDDALANGVPMTVLGSVMNEKMLAQLAMMGPQIEEAMAKAQAGLAGRSFTFDTQDGNTKTFIMKVPRHPGPDDLAVPPTPPAPPVLEMTVPAPPAVPDVPPAPPVPAPAPTPAPAPAPAPDVAPPSAAVVHPSLTTIPTMR